MGRVHEAHSCSRGCFASPVFQMTLLFACAVWVDATQQVGLPLQKEAAPLPGLPNGPVFLHPPGGNNPTLASEGLERAGLICRRRSVCFAWCRGLALLPRPTRGGDAEQKSFAPQEHSGGGRSHAGHPSPYPAIPQGCFEMFCWCSPSREGEAAVLSDSQKPWPNPAAFPRQLPSFPPSPLLPPPPSSMA